MLRKPSKPSDYPRALSRLLPWASVVLLAACASIPPPTGIMSRARAAIDAAQQAGAADADPVDLAFARGKLQQAQQAMGKGKNGKARDLAQESLADSQLALTKARLATLRARVAAQRKENQRLQNQLLQRAPAPGKTVAPGSGGTVEELPQAVLPMPAPPSSAASPVQPAAAASTAGEGH